MDEMQFAFVHHVSGGIRFESVIPSAILSVLPNAIAGAEFEKSQKIKNSQYIKTILNRMKRRM